MFGIGGQFGESGEQFGAVALEGFRKRTVGTDTAYQKKIAKKLGE
jgi:hypothetical protein